MDELKNNLTPLAGVLIIGLLVAANIWLGYETFGEKLERKSAFSPREITAFVFGDKDPSTPLGVKWPEPRTILILGQAGAGNAAPELTDTLMLLHINPLTSPPQVKLISLPRDLYVSIKDRQTKINAVFTRHGPEIAGLVENITGLKINNLVVFDLETVKKVVNEVDGVSVNVPADIYDPAFPAGPGKYEIYSVKAGRRYLDGEEAIRFVRTRSSAQGDFDRIKRQQELFKAIKGKVAALNPFWNFGTLWSVFSIVREDVISDLTLEDARDLWQIGKNVSFDNIEVMSIDTSSGLVEERITNSAYTLVAAGDEPFDYSKIKEAVGEFIK